VAKPKYSTVMEVAFTVEHDCSDPIQLLDDPANVRRVIAALMRRAAELLDIDPKEASEAFGIFDTYDIS
jgi:hypothetical protein